MRPYALLLLAQLAMGSGAVFGRLALTTMTPLAVAAWRLGLVALPLMLRLLWRQRGSLRLPPAARARPGDRLEFKMLLAGLLLALQFVAWMEALRRLSMSMATLLVCTAPVWNSLYEVIFARRRLVASFWAALFLGMGGVGLMLEAGGAHAGLLVRDQLGLGMVLALASSLLIAIYLLLLRHITLLGARCGQVGTFDIISRVFGWGAVALFAALAVEGIAPPPLSERPTWVGVAGMALVTQGVGHSLQNHSLRHLQASIVGFATLLEPLVAALLGWVCFGEALGWQRAAGGSLVVSALGYAMWVTALDADPAVES